MDDDDATDGVDRDVNVVDDDNVDLSGDTDEDPALDDGEEEKRSKKKEDEEKVEDSGAKGEDRRVSDAPDAPSAPSAPALAAAAGYEKLKEEARSKVDEDDEARLEVDEDKEVDVSFTFFFLLLYFSLRRKLDVL